AADQMDKVTQQNAAMVEQATAASQTLSNETEELATLVGRFNTKISAASRQGRATRSGPAMRGSKAARPVTQMRTTGSGGAAPAVSPVSREDSWEEF
ncbi:methyl-accepting chemotaxis protein, partial [Aurantimonas sp. LRZ36]|nr:methyl-accepting chemotaxis protein [Aurantimonas marianensis]